MLEVENLVVRYGQITALREVSLQVGAGEIVAVVGPNGAGKSTLLLTIAGALRQTSGTIRHEGNLLAGRPPEARVRDGIALVPERRRIFATLSVEENLKLGATTRKDRSAVSDDLERALVRFPILRERFHASAAKLSGGEQQQLAIARSLLARPRLLLVDEPSLGLAPRVVRDILEALVGLRASGVTVLLVEQNATQAVDISDRTYLLRNGLVDAAGTKEELLQRRDLFGIYFGMPRVDAAKSRAEYINAEP
jgi:branched-chain amino acid transport system ATP-binding protein